jgi:hypothetical protein
LRYNFYCFFVAVFLSTVSTFSSQAEAAECPIQLKMGLLISPDHIRVLQKGRTQLQINKDEQLFIRGDQIALTPEQTLLVKEFSLGLRKELPEIVSIAMDSVELGFGALNKIIQGISGTDTAQGIEEHFNELQRRLFGRFARSGDNFYLAPQGLNELDDFFEDELSNQVKSVVTNSLHIMLGAMDEAFQQSESEIEGVRIDLGERVDLISKEVENSLKYNASRLEKKATAFCQRFETLDAIEARLQKELPRLRDYDILSNETKPIEDD